MVRCVEEVVADAPNPLVDAVIGSPANRLESPTEMERANETTLRHTAAEIRHVLCEAAELAAGVPWTARMQVPTPREAAFSFACEYNALSWSLEVHLDLAGQPDWTTSVPFAISPSMPR